LVKIAVQLHAAQTPNHHLSCKEGVDTSPCTPKPVLNGWVVLDDTPLFGSPDASGRCNGEKHWRCTTLQRQHETEDPEHLASVAQDRECRSFRRCETPIGYCWRQTAGPRVQFQYRDPGDGERGFQLYVGPFTSEGDYSFLSWACPPVRDEEGRDVPIGDPGEGEVSFRVVAQ